MTKYGNTWDTTEYLFQSLHYQLKGSASVCLIFLQQYVEWHLQHSPFCSLSCSIHSLLLLFSLEWNEILPCLAALSVYGFRTDSPNALPDAVFT